MAEQKILLFDRARKDLGNIIFDNETKKLSVNFNGKINDEIVSLLDKASNDGGVKILVASTIKTKDGKAARIQKPEDISMENPQFMAALTDRINRIINPKAPVFAVLQKNAEE